MTETLEQMLIRHEGKIPHAYQDSLGYWTIGVGRLIDERKGGGLADSEIRLLLRNDIARCLWSLSGKIPWYSKLSEARHDVLVCMCFQLGLAGLMKFKATLAAVERGDYASAAKHMLASKWARQTPERAKELAAIMRG